MHPLGARARVLLRHESGAELTAEVPQSAGDHIKPGMRYRVAPDPASVRAFAANAG